MYNEAMAVVALPGVAKQVDFFPEGIEKKMIDNDFKWAAKERVRILVSSMSGVSAKIRKASRRNRSIRQLRYPTLMETIAEPYLKIRNVTKKFGDFTAINDVNLDIYEGEFVCFLGPSGCGKTTLLRAIAGLDIQTFGTIEQGGTDISSLPPAERDFGIVFQSYALFPNMTVMKNIAYGLVNIGMPKPEIKKRVTELLEMVGLQDQALKYPAQLSGGQQQRVAFARALATKPGLLLLDEPLSALDAKVRAHLRQEMKDLQHDLGVTTIMVTHDQEEALTMADRIVAMSHGVIEQVGTPMQVYREPQSLFVPDFIGIMNFFDAQVAAPGIIQIDKIKLNAAKLNGTQPGTAVTAAIRPEQVRLQDPERHEPNVFNAEVTRLEYLGSNYRTDFHPSGMHNFNVRADISSDLIYELGLDHGRSLRLALPESAIHIYPARHA